jgi:hypothetical protein
MIAGLLTEREVADVDHLRWDLKQVFDMAVAEDHDLVRAAEALRMADVRSAAGTRSALTNPTPVPSAQSRGFRSHDAVVGGAFAHHRMFQPGAIPRIWRFRVRTTQEWRSPYAVGMNVGRQSIGHNPMPGPTLDSGAILTRAKQRRIKYNAL